MDKIEYLFLEKKNLKNKTILLSTEDTEFNQNYKSILILELLINNCLTFEKYLTTIKLKGLGVLNKLKDVTEI